MSSGEVIGGAVYLALCAVTATTVLAFTGFYEAHEPWVSALVTVGCAAGCTVSG
ncbi:MAG: hypothetical protein JSS50_01775 [Proteobacteria bacterium]|nr:hypothetical protein [Pseudomonadota bacterium]